MNTGNWRTPLVILVCGALVLGISLGVRHAFGLFLQPMSNDLGWGRETFAFAMAIQNLMWGLTAPITGRIADRYGAGWTVLGGSFLYIAGLFLMSKADSELSLLLSAGILIGVGLSGTTFSVIMGVISRAVSVEKRSWAMGVSAAAGSFGQFLFLPVSNTLLLNFGWSSALVLMTIICLLMIPLSFALMEPAQNKNQTTQPTPLKEVLTLAASHRDYWLLCFGFFVCGFQVVFIAVHLPAFLTDNGLSPSVAAIVLGLVGLFNVFGSYYAGVLGGSKPKPKLLTLIYSLRFVAIAIFLLLPLSPTTAYLFGITLGLLWLSTVPLTNGTVATLFGAGNLSMLGGIVFLFHQVGSFFGGWLGGYLYDAMGSYYPVWIMTLVLSVIAALLNWPIRERPVVKMEATA